MKLIDAKNILTEEEMLDGEMEVMWGTKGRPPQTCGIALSGGGVRASIVALGVLQKLAEEGLLAKFDYMSSVSGGGYIASALSWFWSPVRAAAENGKPEFGPEKGKFPFQDPVKFVRPDNSASPEWWEIVSSLSRRLRPLIQAKPFDREAVQGARPGQDIESAVQSAKEAPPPSPKKYAELAVGEKAARNLAFLRNHGSYLTSGDGVGFAALVIAVVRTVLVSLCVWVPFLVSIFYFANQLDKSWTRPFDAICRPWAETACNWLPENLKHPLYSVLIFITVLLLGFVVLSVVTLSFIRPSGKNDHKKDILRRIFDGILYFISSLSPIFALYFYLKYRDYDEKVGFFLVPGVLISAYFFALGVAQFSDADASYFLRRNFDKWSHAVVPLITAVLYVGLLPFIYQWIVAYHSVHMLLDSVVFAPLFGIFSVLSGIGTALYGYYTKARSVAPSIATQSLAVGGAVIFLFGLSLCSFHLSLMLEEVSDDKHQKIAVYSIFVLALALGFLSSVNATGLHRFYRDRLMETFMPMMRAIQDGLATQSRIADMFSIRDLWDEKSGIAGRPYHLINAHAILTRDKDSRVAIRGGDNFILSYAMVGSTATGWMKTADYLKGNGALTLASAMAASGAAANANAGYIGTGVTRERFVSLVMSILNIRLGIWVNNPRALARRWFPTPGQRPATYFGPQLVNGILGFGKKRQSKFIELSDGGHFENLGLYELVRRKVNLIVVVDAEQDGSINLSALVSSANRVREDFGAVITFSEGYGPELLIGQASKQYPSGVSIATSPFIVGRIKYADDTSGALVYIKSTMITGLEFATDGYRASHPEFPHQSTADQFFDPEQFEAYRDLGRKSCKTTIDNLKLATNWSASGILKQYDAFAKENWLPSATT